MFIALVLAVATATPDPYTIYSRVRNRWAAQSYPPFLKYVVTTSGNDGQQRITNTYESFTDTSSKTITVHATSAEEAAHPYFPVGVNVRAKITVSYTRHPRLFSAPSIDGGGDISATKTIRVTNQQQFDLLGVPMLSPTYSFGLEPTPISAKAQTVQTAASRGPALKTIATVTAVHNDYDIRYDGTAVIDDVPCYHLDLTPRGDPAVYRLRQLWVDQDDFTTRKALLQGNFTQGPGPRLRWLIHFEVSGDLMYISDEIALGPVRYLRRTYSSVTITFSNIQPAKSLDPISALSMFRTSGDVLEEP